MSAPRMLVELLTGRGETLATAESLTAGLVAATIADVPGASAVLVGGVVAYATEVKVAQLGVDVEIVERDGVVSAACAEAMAAGARSLFATTYGLATTGVAGPGEQEGKPVGTVFIACVGPSGVTSARLCLDGGRSQIRTATVAAVLELTTGEVRRAATLGCVDSPREEPGLR